MIFIVSDTANHFNARRLCAREFDRNIDPLKAGTRASDPIAWTGATIAGEQVHRAVTAPHAGGMGQAVPPTSAAGDAFHENGAAARAPEAVLQRFLVLG